MRTRKQLGYPDLVLLLRIIVGHICIHVKCMRKDEMNTEMFLCS